MAVWHTPPTFSWIADRAIVGTALGRQAVVGFREGKLSAGESPFESLQKLTSEHLTQYSNGKQEVRPACPFPRRPLQCQAAGGDYAMKMRMVKQVLSPGVKNAEESDLCT